MLKRLRVMCVCVLSLSVAMPLFAGEVNTPQKKADKKVEKKIDKKVEKQPGEKKAAKKVAEKKAGEKKPAKAKPDAGLVQAAKLFQPPRGVKLNDDQHVQLKSLKQKYASQLKDAFASAKLTKDQAAARKEAMTKAKADGLKGKQLQQAADAAAKLTDEQRKARDTIAAIRKEVQTSIRSMLTDDQKAALPGKAGKKKPKKAAE